jgi:hypothetical protein
MFLMQVRQFLSVNSERVAPAGWWCPAPARNASPAPDETFSDDETCLENQQHMQQQQQLQPLDHFYSQQQHVEQQQQYLLPQQFPRQRAASLLGGRCPGVGAGESLLEQAVAAATAAAADCDDEDALGDPGRGYGRRSIMHPDIDEARGDEEYGGRGYGGNSRRTEQPRQQLWAASGSRSRHGSDHTTEELQQQQQQQHRRVQRSRQQRLLSGNGYGSDVASEAEGIDSDGDLGSGAGIHPRFAANGQQAAYCPSSYMQQRRWQLLQQEGPPAEGTASESEVTDTDSLAMAAMAIAELAHSGSWDHLHTGATSALQAPPAQDKQQMHCQDLVVAAGDTADQLGLLPAMPAGPAQQQTAVAADTKPVQVKLEPRPDGVALGVFVRQAQQQQQQQAAAVDAGGQISRPLPGMSRFAPPAQQKQHQQLPPWSQQGQLSLPGDHQTPLWTSTRQDGVPPATPAAAYNHGGAGLPSSTWWQCRLVAAEA